MDLIIGLGDYAISAEKSAVLRTFALASCVALTAYEPRAGVLGMVHIVLPAAGRGKLPTAGPAYYGDTAVPLLIRQVSALAGVAKESLVLQVFGGASSLGEHDVFQVGPRNLAMVEGMLEHIGLKAHHHDIGGHVSRSLVAPVATGLVRVTYQPLIV